MKLAILCLTTFVFFLVNEIELPSPFLIFFFPLKTQSNKIIEQKKRFETFREVLFILFISFSFFYLFFFSLHSFVHSRFHVSERFLYRFSVHLFLFVFFFCSTTLTGKFDGLFEIGFRARSFLWI